MLQWALERDNLRGAQAGSVGHAERRPVFERPGAASRRRLTSSGLRITGSLRGSRTVAIAACASLRPSVTPKKKRKADTAAFMPVAEDPRERRCS